MTHQTILGLFGGFLLGLVLGTGVLALAQGWDPYAETNQQIWQQQQELRQMETLQRLRNQDFQRQLQDLSPSTRPLSPC